MFILAHPNEKGYLWDELNIGPASLFAATREIATCQSANW
jgi:hypothetical protein